MIVTAEPNDIAFYTRQWGDAKSGGDYCVS